MELLLVPTKEYKASWLLNYRGGSFLLPDLQEIRKECQIRGVSFEILSDNDQETILNQISSPFKIWSPLFLKSAQDCRLYSKGKMPWMTPLL
jgi:hypothetical protein